MKHLRLALLCLSTVGLVLYGCSGDAPTDSPDVLSVSAPVFSLAAPFTETLGDIDPPAPAGTGIVAAGVGMRGDPAVEQPGIINLNVPGAVVKAYLFWEGQMSTAVVGDNQVTVNGTSYTGTFLGGPIKIAPIGDEWTTTFRADITAEVGAGANVLNIADMNFNSRCPDCRNDGAMVLGVYDDGGDAGQVTIREGCDFAYGGYAPPRQGTDPQTFNFDVDPENERTATLILGVGSVNSNDRPNIVCVSIDGGTPVEYVDILDSVDGDDWDTVTLNPMIPAGASSMTVEIKSERAATSSYPETAQPASLVWLAAGLHVPPPEEEGIGCRVTGGLVDDSGACRACPSGSSGDNTFTAGGQAGANTALPPQPSGNWTHSNHKGAAGKFTFHAGTPSAPEGTEIAWIACMDPDNCNPAREAPAKQIDFGGVGTFKNLKNNCPDIIKENVTVGESLHYFEVNIDDLGEPGRGGKQDPPSETCPVNGFGLYGDEELADCDCPDFYRITIWSGPTDESQVIYEAQGYIRGGNFQIHPLTGYDRTNNHAGSGEEFAQ